MGARFKEGKSVKSDKEILGGECPTPDCQGIVIEIKTADHMTNQSKKTLPKTDNPADAKDAQKKTKSKTRPSAENLKRRLERKEEKKRRRLAAKQMLEEV